jgi:hypothetical protein
VVQPSFSLWRFLAIMDFHIANTVWGGAERGHVDGPIATARFHRPRALLLLPDGSLLVADSKHIRKISADLQQVSTIAGDGTMGSRTARQRRPGSAASTPSSCWPTAVCS